MFCHDGRWRVFRASGEVVILNYREKYGDSKVLIELDDSTLIYGVISEEDSAFILVDNSLEITPDGKAYSHSKTVVKRNKIKSVENPKIDEIREIAAERRTDDYTVLILSAFFGAAILFLILGFG